MPLWVWMVLLAALIKLPIAGLLLWVPFRYDDSMRAPEPQDSSEEDGGSKALPGGPMDPHPRSPLPRSPRRGPHGDPSPPSPPRIRTTVHSRRRVALSR
ncbi:MAG TPA: hypothetical protein VGN08_04185 [Solirubrobacteraceae bacterium]|jgi:hypothetical protein